MLWLNESVWLQYVHAPTLMRAALMSGWQREGCSPYLPVLADTFHVTPVSPPFSRHNVLRCQSLATACSASQYTSLPGPIFSLLLPSTLKTHAHSSFVLADLISSRHPDYTQSHTHTASQWITTGFSQEISTGVLLLIVVSLTTPPTFSQTPPCVSNTSDL